MKIERIKFKELFYKVKDSVVDALVIQNKYKENNSYFPKYYKFPKPLWTERGTMDIEQYNEILSAYPQIKYGVDSFYISTCDTPINYAELFGLKNKNYKINIDESDKFKKLCDFIKQNSDISKIMYGDTKDIEYKTCKFIAEIVNRLMYIGQKDLKINKLIFLKLSRYFYKTLQVNICIPINYVLFSSDKIQLDDDITIEKIPKEMQISRFYFSHFDSDSENKVLQNCAYMIVLKNRSFSNDNNLVLEQLKKNYWAYPIEKIDDILATIRIVTGFNIGYSQILMEPIKWVDELCTDMTPIYGPTIRAFNRKFIEGNFFDYTYNKITDDKIIKIKNMYKYLKNIRTKDTKQKKKLENKKSKPKNEIPYNKIFIAIKKLNKCLLKEEADDSALEAILGIEALLSDTQNALKYTLSNRVAIMSSQVAECNYNPKDMRKAMKYMYGLRSKIVHGEYVKKEELMVKIGNTKVQFKDLAIEFLRYSLIFILSNEVYLKSSRFEDLLDRLLIKAKKNTL